MSEPIPGGWSGPEPDAAAERGPEGAPEQGPGPRPEPEPAPEPEPVSEPGPERTSGPSEPERDPEPEPESEPGPESVQEPPREAGSVPLGVARTSTGVAEVDTQLDRLADADHLPVSGHLEVYEDVHRGLRDTLTALDRRPGPPAPSAP